MMRTRDFYKRFVYKLLLDLSWHNQAGKGLKRRILLLDRARSVNSTTMAFRAARRVILFEILPF